MLLLLSGPSCVGKSYCMERLCRNDGFRMVLPYTTRAPRATEVHGVDYHFCSRAELMALSAELSKGYWAQPVGDHWYGYPDRLEDLAETEERWVAQAHSSIALRAKAANRKTLAVFLDCATEACLLERFRTRFAGAEFQTRLEHATRERAVAHLYDHRVVSDDLACLEAEVIGLVHAAANGPLGRVNHRAEHLG